MVKTPYVDENGIRKGTWSEEEDEKLKAFVNSHGHLNWRQLPKLAGLSRCGKSCRLRWMNYLRPDVKRGNFSKEEEDIIIKLHESLGNRWSVIAAQLPGRTDNEVKNQWHSFLKKRTMETLDHSKVDHKPKSKSRGYCQKSKSSRLENEGSTSTVGDFVIHGILESSDLSNISTSSFNDSSISNDEWMGTYSNVTKNDPVMSMYADGNDVFSRENLDEDVWMKSLLASDSENNTSFSSPMDWSYPIPEYNQEYSIHEPYSIPEYNQEYSIHEPYPIPEEEFNVFLW